MNEEYITNLPSEITINILFRLPVRSIICSKCVCKPWLDIIETSEFAKSHLSKSVPGLVVHHYEARRLIFPASVFKIFDIEETIEPHEHHYNKIREITFLIDTESGIMIQGSANGLIFFQLQDSQHKELYICNPITHEYIKLPSPERIIKNHRTIEVYGFGVSKITEEYKVVRIVVQTEPECEVYTLGTGTWRSVACGVSFNNNRYSIGTFHNGKIHWLVPDLKGCLTLISSFDLETETFSILSPSPPTLPESESLGGAPLVFDGCLCLCDKTSDDEIVIWTMKNESWIKGFIISNHPDLGRHPSYEWTYPVMVFRNDVLMTWLNVDLFYYSGKDATTRGLDVTYVGNGRIEAMHHTSSFVSPNVNLLFTWF